MKEEIEEWRAVPGYEGWYEVSSWGRVRRLLGREEDPQYRVLKLCRCKTPTGDFYQDAALSKCGVEARFRVHRIVFSAFLGSIPEGMEVNHKNGIKSDNRLGNLEIGTHADNMAHASRMRLMPFGERGSAAKLTSDQVREIRRLANTVKGAELGRRFGVTRGAIYAVVHRKSWDHL